MRPTIMAAIVGGLLVFPLGGVSQADEVPSGKSGKLHLLVQLVRENDEFKVVQVTEVPSGLPKERGKPRSFPWRFQVVGQGERVLYQGGLDDPSVLRGEFSNEGDPKKIDAVFLKKAGGIHFSIRFPEIRAGRIEFYELIPGVQVKDGTFVEGYRKIGSALIPVSENK
jgi:hypothetical protein